MTFDILHPHSAGEVSDSAERLPEQIACAPCWLETPGWQAAHRWIYEKRLVNESLKVLRNKGESRKGKEARGKCRKDKSVRKRDTSPTAGRRPGAGKGIRLRGIMAKARPAFGVLSERRELIRGRSRPMKTGPGVEQRQVPQSLGFVFRPGMMGL